MASMLPYIAAPWILWVRTWNNGMGIRFSTVSGQPTHQGRLHPKKTRHNTIWIACKKECFIEFSIPRLQHAAKKSSIALPFTNCFSGHVLIAASFCCLNLHLSAVVLILYLSKVYPSCDMLMDQNSDAGQVSFRTSNQSMDLDHLNYACHLLPSYRCSPHTLLSWFQFTSLTMVYIYM